MTNLLATIIVSIVTNVFVPTVEIPPGTWWTQDTQSRDNIQCTSAIWRDGAWIFPIGTQTRTEVTEVVEITEVRFTLNGEPWSVKKEKVLSRKERRQVKKEVWEDAQ